jgi:hypothetical protein
MVQFGKELQVYAECGLRTADNWVALGRQVTAGSKPRSNADYRGGVVELFTRDQTERRPARERK